MMTKEKKQGREAAYREMGIDPNDTKMVSMFKAFIESQKSDEQKANEAAAQNAAKIAEAERRANLAEAKAEAEEAKEKMLNAARKMKAKGYSIEDIAEITGLTAEEIEGL